MKNHGSTDTTHCMDDTMYGLTDMMHRVVDMTHSVAEMTRGMMWRIHSLGQLNWKLIHFALYRFIDSISCKK